MAFFDISSTATANGGNLTISYPANMANGDILVACITIRSTVGFSTPSGWTKIDATESLGGNTATSNGIASCQHFWRRHDGTGTSQVFSRTGGDLAMGVVLVFTGRVASGDPVDVTSLSVASGTTLTPTGITTSDDNADLVWHNALADNGTVSGVTGTTPSSWAERVDNGTNTGADGGINVNTAAMTTAGATSGITGTSSINGTHARVLIALKREPPALTNDVRARIGSDASIISTALTVTIAAAGVAASCVVGSPGISVEHTAPQVTATAQLGTPTADDGSGGAVIHDVRLRVGTDATIVSRPLTVSFTAPKVTATAQIGTATVQQPTQDITPVLGSLAALLAGSVQRADHARVPDGQAVTSAHGTPVVTVPGEVFANPTGVVATAAIGSPTINISLTPSGLVATAQLLSPVIGLSQTVAPTGLTVTPALGVPVVAFLVQNITPSLPVLSAVVGTPSASDQSGGTPTGGSTPGTEVRTQVQVDVWSNWECAGGVALALGVPCSACTEHQEIVEHTATKRLTVEFPAAWEPAGHVVTGNVFRLTEIDGTVSEFRIDDVSEASPLGMKSATANDPLMDLAQAREIISETNANLTDFAVEKTDTASNLLTFVLGFAPSYVTLGTVTSTTRVKVTFDWAMPLAAAQAVATAIKSDEGVTYQISLRRNGASGYLLDLTVLGATATVATFRTAKNLAAFSKRTVGQDYANRVYPQTAWSDQTGVGEHLFLVTAVSTNAYIEIDDPAFRGTNPITEDDALNNLFWVPYNEAAGTATARMITDTVKASKRLHMASTSGIAVGDMGRIARNSGKDFLSYVETPSRQASGIRVVRLTTSDLAFDNVFANPSAQRWTAGQIDYWTSTGTGGWPAEETSVVFTGTRSIRFQNNAANSFYRFRSHNARIWTARSSSLQVKFRVWYKNLKNGDTNAVFFQISTNPSTTQLVTGGVEVADWTAWESSASALTTIRNELWLEVVQTAIAGNTNARAYIGHVEAIVHETGTTLPPGPVLASNTTGAWLRGVTYLANDPATYDVGVMDLTRQDQAQWPYDGLTLGGSVSVVPDDLATVSNRVVGMEKDHLNRMNTRITLAKQADKLSAIVAAS